MIKFGLKQKRINLIIWLVVIALFTLMAMTKADLALGDDAGFSEIIDSLPQIVLAVYGFGSYDIATLSGYYGIIVNFILLFVGIYAILLTTSLYATEDNDHTFEYLLTKPVNRIKVANSKNIVATINIVIFVVVTTIFTILSVIKFEDSEIYGLILQQGIYLLSFGLMMQGVSNIVLSIVKELKNSMKISMVVFMLLYFINIFYSFFEDAEILKYLTPFSFLSTQTLMDEEMLLYGPIVAIVIYVVGLLLVRKTLVNREY